MLKGAMDPWKLLDFGLNECGAIYSCFPTIMLRYKLLLGSKCKTVSFIEQIGWRPSYSSRWVIQSWWKLVFQEDKFSKNGHAGGKFCGTPSYNASKGQILKSATSGWATLPGLTFFADFFTFQWLFQLSLAYFPSLTPAVLHTYSWKLSNLLLLLEHIPRYVSHLWPNRQWKTYVFLVRLWLCQSYSDTGQCQWSDCFAKWQYAKHISF